MRRSAHAFSLFDTAMGTFGVAWSERGIVWVQLPDSTPLQTRARLLRGVPDAGEGEPPPAIRDAIDGIIALVAGQPTDLNGVSLDMDGVPDFHRRVYEVARTIPAGSTLSYGQLAARLGSPTDAWSVGQALGHNPFPIVVPCHRVVAVGGKLGGFSAPGGARTKLRLLALEGAPHQLRLDMTRGDAE